MSAPHVHLILNHFPVVGIAAAAGLLTLAVALRRSVLGRAGLWALVASAVLAVPVYLTGHEAEEVVEEMGIAERFIEAHEEAALVTLIALLVLGAVAASALWLYRQRDALPRKLVIGMWVLSLGGGVLAARTANLGGEIRHEEIRGELFGGGGADGEEVSDAREAEDDGAADVVLEDGAAHVDGLGTVRFPTSASGEAQRHFLRGVLLLHSFEYEDARAAFRKAREDDPGFVMAYWGEAMTHDHPLWRQQDREAARAALERLAPTREARLAEAATERERAYLEAVETLYGDGPEERRDTLYARAMERLVSEFPDDDEARAFYALSLLGLNQGERDVPTFMRAGAIAVDLFERHPRHPGAVHYAIHSFDDPAHAPLGLEAARAYSDIAPRASHAQHMTSHIFVALGMWDDVVAANEAATRTGARAADHGYELHPCGHNAEWLAYGYLQQGRAQAARRLITRCLDLAEDDAGRRGSAARMRAHYLVDTRRGSGPVAELDLEASGLPARWALARDFGDGIAAAYRGEADRARRALSSLEGRLRGLREGLAADGRVIADVLRAEILAAEGDTASALEAARRASERAARRPVPYGPPSTYEPPLELEGELLLGSGRAEEARSTFVRALQRTPRRPRALLGKARASAALGRTEQASAAYAALERIWSGADPGWPGREESREYLAEHDGPPGSADRAALPR